MVRGETLVDFIPRAVDLRHPSREQALVTDAQLNILHFDDSDWR